MIMGDELASQSEARTKKCREAQKKCVQIYKNSFPQVDRQNFLESSTAGTRCCIYTNDMM